MNGLRFCLLISVALSVSCARHNEPPLSSTDAGQPRPDAAASDCASQANLQIGHCIDRDTGNPCRDFDSEQREFVPLGPGVVVPQIVGFQGSPMFVLAVRASDLEGSPEERSPLVQLEVSRGDFFIGGYTSRPDFIADPDSSIHRIAPQLYVVTLLSDEAIGNEAEVLAMVTAPSGTACAETTFMIGALVDEPTDE